MLRLHKPYLSGDNAVITPHSVSVLVTGLIHPMTSRFNTRTRDERFHPAPILATKRKQTEIREKKTITTPFFLFQQVQPQCTETR